MLKGKSKMQVYKAHVLIIAIGSSNEWKIINNLKKTPLFFTFTIKRFKYKI